MKQFLLIGLGLLLTGPSSAGDIDVKTERAALLRTDKSWAAAAAAKDVERIVSYWTDDAQVFPPGQPPVIGKDALRRYVSESMAIPGFAISWETNDFVVSKSGDIAYGIGTNIVTFNGPDGKPFTQRGRAVTTWRRQSDGAWRCAVDIWNAEPPSAASPK